VKTQWGYWSLLRWVEPEADLDGHLEVGDLTVHNVPPDIHQFEPIKVAYGLAGAIDRTAYGVVDRLCRAPDDFTDTVGMIAHSITLLYMPSIVVRPPRHKTCDSQTNLAPSLPCLARSSRWPPGGFDRAGSGMTGCS